MTRFPTLLVSSIIRIFNCLCILNYIFNRAMLYLFIFYLFHFGKKHENCIGQKKYSWKKFKAKTKIFESLPSYK